MLEIEEFSVDTFGLSAIRAVYDVLLLQFVFGLPLVMKAAQDRKVGYIDPFASSQDEVY